MKRLKHWLIKKLGGYVDPSNVYRVEHFTTPFVRLDAIATFPWGESIDEDTIRWCLARELAKEIKRGELYDIEESENPLEREIHYRISVRVAPHRERSDT